MRKTREEKAITLIALIITIVVLLILAVVAINAVTGDGIIQHATNAKTEYEKAQDEENSMISYYETYLENKGDVGPWKQEGNIIYKTDSNGQRIELQIGDKVKYDEGTNHKTTPNPKKGIGTTIEPEYDENNRLIINTQECINENLEWRLLGISKNGKLELISTKPTTTEVVIGGKLGYIYVEENLNTFCNELYGKGKGAVSARSLKVEDLNKLSGYNPTSYEEYGSTTNYTSGTFITEDLETVEATETNPVAFKITTYTYSMGDIKIITRDGIQMSNIISKGESGSVDMTQWLASRNMKIGTLENVQLPSFCVFAIGSGAILRGNIYFSNEVEKGISCVVRPVVTLNANVILTDTDGDEILEIN